ncbi:RusA family crossover junction endodeoxyribonuclease [Clostridium tarantellae]|uniref:RusA family crossover junction endodeoxyribonuclease n=1 Tax=Clostridium tarantellae TaxID=39493 RepID=A0A6I1MPP5_9CLOT|nr:RusA family crossover junction endodeoxyribonuclease [Clostridium tarantellae]MPQ44192.1 RusA family crossover junction endodeoxyribonuclease [Clostridium tarantellae]
MNCYAKVIVKGSPITKSNFKLFNSKGRAILPTNSGKYHDRYAVYEEEIAYQTKNQNPNLVLKESLIAILKVYYKSEKRHPDTNNITKSIFDGIEKSGLIINDMQIRRIIIEEFYDKENPRFELELFGESSYKISYEIIKHKELKNKILYDKPPNKKKSLESNSCKTYTKKLENKNTLILSCSICNKTVTVGEYVSANKGTTIICRKCLSKTF